MLIHVPILRAYAFIAFSIHCIWVHLYRYFTPLCILRAKFDESDEKLRLSFEKLRNTIKAKTYSIDNNNSNAPKILPSNV